MYLWYQILDPTGCKLKMSDNIYMCITIQWCMITICIDTDSKDTDTDSLLKRPMLPGLFLLSCNHTAHSIHIAKGQAANAQQS